MGGGSSEPEKEHRKNDQEQNKDKQVTMNSKNISVQITLNSSKKRQQQKIKNSSKQILEKDHRNEDDIIPSLNLKLPLCNNKKKVTHVCLDENCKQYPFFCLQCEFLCEQNHHHDNRLNSVSFKQFEKRLSKMKTVSSQLKQAESGYKQTLLMLKQSLAELYDCQITFLEDIQSRKSLCPEALTVKAKIQKNEKSGLSGRMINQLWNQAASWPEEQQQIIAFLKKKQQLLVNLLEAFQNINNATKEAMKGPPKKKQLKPAATHQKTEEVNDKRTYHLFNRYELDSQKIEICKQKNWNSGKIASKRS